MHLSLRVRLELKGKQMSTANIVSIESFGTIGAAVGGAIGGAFGGAAGAEFGAEVGEAAGNLFGCTVTFRLRNGSTRSYVYYGSDATAIMAGADPASYSGTEV